MLSFMIHAGIEVAIIAEKSTCNFISVMLATIIA